MSKQKRPITKHDVIRILKSIASHNGLLSSRLSDIDILIGHYIDFKGDTEDFSEYLDGKYKLKEHNGSGEDATVSEE